MVHELFLPVYSRYSYYSIKETYLEHSDVDLCSFEIALGFVANLFECFLGYLGMWQRIVL